MDWRNAVIAMDMKRISAILSINQSIVAVSLVDIPSDIQIPAKLGNPSEMSALQYTLTTMWSYNTSMSPNEKQLQKARKQLVDLLMQSSLASDLDYQNDHGDTALHYAVALDIPDIAASIVARGASADLKNKDNATPENLVASANTRSVLETAIRQRPAIRALRQNSFVSNSVFKQNIQNSNTNRMTKTRVPEYSSKNRFTELKRLAESSASASDQRVVTMKDVNNYIRPGMLEQKKKGLSLEEQQREERIQQAKRRAEVEQLVTKKVVNTSRFVTERSKSTPNITTVTSTTAVPPVPTSAENEQDGERKFSALKEKSYVSTSVFRQHSMDSDDSEECSPTHKHENGSLTEEQLANLNVGGHYDEEDVMDDQQEVLLAEEPGEYYHEEHEEEEEYASLEEYETVEESQQADHQVVAQEEPSGDRHAQDDHEHERDIVVERDEHPEISLDDNAYDHDHGDDNDNDNDQLTSSPTVEIPVDEEQDELTDVYEQPKVAERNIRDSVPHPIKLFGLDDAADFQLTFDKIVITPAATQETTDGNDHLTSEPSFLRPRSGSNASAVSNNSIVHDIQPAVSEIASSWNLDPYTRKSSMTIVDQQDTKGTTLDDDSHLTSDTASILDVSFPSSQLNFDDEIMSFRSFEELDKPNITLKTLPQTPQRDLYGSTSVANTSTYTSKQSSDEASRPSLSSVDSSSSKSKASTPALQIDAKNITFSKSTGLTNLPIAPSIRRKPIGLMPEKTKSETIPRTQDRSSSRQGSYAIDDDDVPLSATRRSPPTLENSDSSKPSLRHIRSNVSHLRGKLLVRICRFNVEPTLTMPKEPFYLRCILTDGRNEYQSQYTQLGNEIDINQGCLISAYPDMKFRLSLQARPDAYDRPKKQLQRLLSTAARKPANTVLNLVNKEDGHFGQTRIQLRSIAHLCRNSLYTAAFDCYNNWSAISKTGAKSNAARDNLVVVGNLVLQLFFIPYVEGVRLPNTVKECEAGLDIKRWYNTSWLSGEICIRKPKRDETWRKRYVRLIGAHLYIHRDIHDNQHESRDLTSVKVLTADKKIIAKAVRKPDPNAGAATSRLADFITSDDIIDEEEEDLYCADALAFRCTFKDGSRMDILCEAASARDRWLKAFKGVMNKAPSIPGWLAQDLSNI